MNLRDVVAVDIETTGLQWKDRVLVISLARESDREPTDEELFNGKDPFETVVLNAGYWQEANLFGLMGAEMDASDEEIRPDTPPELHAKFWSFVGDRTILVMHNASFDLPFLIATGIIPVDKLDSIFIYDTMSMARATEQHNDGVSLQALLKEICKPDGQWLADKGHRANLVSQPWELVERYATMDAVYTLQLWAHQYALAEEYYGPLGSGGLLDEESDWVKTVSIMRWTGIQVDEDKLNGIGKDLKTKLVESMKVIRPAGIKGPNDRTGILRWAEKEGLTDLLGLTPKGARSTDSDSMARLAEICTGRSTFEGGGWAEPNTDEEKAKAETQAEIAATISIARSLEKAISTWITGTQDEMDAGGRVHPLFTVSGARSNRLSCRYPNTQAYPKAYKCFTAREGYTLWSLDWSQAELRIAAMYAKERKLAEILATPGSDAHMETAILLFGAESTKDHRQLAKRANFGSIYGAGVRAIVEACGCSEAVARNLLSSHRGLYPNLQTISKACERIWKKRGYLRLMSGKRLYGSEDDLKNRAYKAFNQLIQGAVAEMTKRAMLLMRELPVILVNQIHDSIELAIRTGDNETLNKCVDIMQNASFSTTIQQECDPFVPLLVDAEHY